MVVRALFFASYRDLAGTDELMVELPAAARIHDLVVALRDRRGSWDGFPVDPVAARNMAYAPLDCALQEGDEVAFIPPVSGG